MNIKHFLKRLTIMISKEDYSRGLWFGLSWKSGYYFKENSGFHYYRIYQICFIPFLPFAFSYYSGPLDVL